MRGYDRVQEGSYVLLSVSDTGIGISTEDMERIFDLFAVSDFLLANPEIAYQEFKARDYLSQVLEQKGFEVEKGVGNVETSFLARPNELDLPPDK